MPLKIALHHLQTIRRHAEQTYPQECCGLLAGVREAEGWLVADVFPAENAWNEDAVREVFQDTLQDPIAEKERRYAIAPETMLRVQRETRDRQLAIAGIYHSHPDHPAVPSECDREYAWSEYVYVIVSVPQGHSREVLAWRLDEERQFQPEEIITLDEKPQQQ